MKNTFLCIALTLACIATESYAQPSPAGQARSLSHAIHAVDDLDTTLAFYRDVFGISGNVMEFDNPAVPLLTNAPGVTLRLSMIGLPGGMRFEFTHFMGLERQAAEASYTDPGAASLIFFVRDIDSLVTAARGAGARVVTTGGEPVEIATANGTARSIIFRDPDGFFLQLIEETPLADAPEGNLHRVTLAYTIGDAETTRDFYTGMMGMTLTGSSVFKKDIALARLIGAHENLEFRTLNGSLPPNANIKFTEFRGIERTKFHLRVRDPGAPAMAIEVSNIVEMLAQMKSAGVNIISANEELVDFGNGVSNIFVEDPNGVNLELIERLGAE